MRINAINNYNTTPVNFSGKDKKPSNSLRNAAMATLMATGLSMMTPSCRQEAITHEHHFDVPVDTFVKKELTPTQVPPQIIYVEKEVPGKNDTIIIKDSIPYIVEKNDTIWETKYDTIRVPEFKTDTVWQTKYDTIKVPEYITKYDTIFKTDTIVQPGDTILKRDTVTLPGETIYVKEDWKSPVPPKQQEIYEQLGIETTGQGKFFLSLSYYDRKNSVLVSRNLNGMASSRDGKVLVYNVIKTGWDHEAEGVTLGKNEKFEKHLVYLSDDGESLGMKIMTPKSDVNVSNNNGRPNWTVFEKGKLSTPSAWNETSSFFATLENGIVKLTNGFKLKQGMTPNAVTTVNPYDSEWELINWNVVKGDPD
ncbi:hypothetical protein IKU74_03920 [bacterium]|nr:hypothetical protein [bacterium]